MDSPYALFSRCLRLYLLHLLLLFTPDFDFS
jgi:hypothetical protein